MPKINFQKRLVNSKWLTVKGQFGHIALTSTIILSAVFVMLFAGMTGLFVGGMERIEDAESSQKARSLLNNCVEVALDEIRKDSDYQGNEVLGEGDEICVIEEVFEGGGDVLYFTVRGEYKNYIHEKYVEVEVIEDGEKRSVDLIFWD